MYQINLLKEMKLYLGAGKNNFTMSHGSFSYSRIEGLNSFALNEVQNAKNGFDLIYGTKRKHELCRIQVREKDGRIHVDCHGKYPKGVNRFRVSFPANPKEKIYGCGETYSKFNLKNEKIRIWVAEHQNAGRIGKKMIRQKATQRIIGKGDDRTGRFSAYESYYAQPTFVSSDCWYAHVDTDSYCEFDFRKKNVITLNLQEEPHFVIESAHSFEELSERMSSLLGRQRELPDWIYDGAVLAMQGGTEVLQKKIDRALEAGVKLCGVWSQDWCGCRRTGFGYQVMWNWEWDRELYPGLDRKIAEWKEQGIHFLGYINPFMALEKDLYKEASAKGYCVHDKKGRDYLVKITTFPAAMIDFTNPEAYSWYKRIIRDNMIGFGLSGWMADFGEYLPVDCVLYSGEDPEMLHNRWPAIWAKMNREVIEEAGKQDEIFFFTRAGYTGTVRESAMMWTGDQHVDWSVDDGLPSVIPATLSLAMSGYGITHSDAGGYTSVMHMKRTKELLMRWEEMNVFSPLLRTHEGNRPSLNVQFDADEELLKHTADCSLLHAALKPYLKDLVRQTAEKGTPVIRPLFYHYHESTAYEITDEYMLGRDVLVCPVVKEGKTGRNVFLPNDSWIHMFTHKEYQGGTFYEEAPLGRPAVYVRKGSEYADILLNTERVK